MYNEIPVLKITVNCVLMLLGMVVKSMLWLAANKNQHLLHDLSRLTWMGWCNI